MCQFDGLIAYLVRCFKKETQENYGSRWQQLSALINSYHFLTLTIVGKNMTFTALRITNRPTKKN